MKPSPCYSGSFVHMGFFFCFVWLCLRQKTKVFWISIFFSALSFTFRTMDMEPYKYCVVLWFIKWFWYLQLCTKARNRDFDLWVIATPMVVGIAWIRIAIWSHSGRLVILIKIWLFWTKSTPKSCSNHIISMCINLAQPGCAFHMVGVQHGLDPALKEPPY